MCESSKHTTKSPVSNPKKDCSKPQRSPQKKTQSEYHKGPKSSWRPRVTPNSITREDVPEIQARAPAPPAPTRVVAPATSSSTSCSYTAFSDEGELKREEKPYTVYAKAPIDDVISSPRPKARRPRAPSSPARRNISPAEQHCDLQWQRKVDDNGAESRGRPPVRRAPNPPGKPADPRQSVDANQ